MDTSSTAPTAGQALIWDASDNEWVPGTITSGTDISAQSINALSDVDTSTTAPTAGQALVWNATDSEWVPGNVSFNASGTIYLTGSSTDRVYRYDGTSWDSGFAVPTGEGTPSGITVDPSNGDILIVGFNQDRVYRWDGTSWDSGFAIPATEFTANGIAVDPSNGDILIAGFSTGRVYRHNGTSWDAGFAIPSAETSPQGIAVDPANGDILLIGFTRDLIYRHNGTSWDSGLAIPSGESSPGGVAVDPSNGDILIVGFGQDRVYRYDGTSWDSGFAIPTGEGTPRGIAIYFPDPVIPRNTNGLPEGARNLYFTDARADARISASSINALSDVDTVSAAPTNGQALIWNSTDSEWVPGTVSGGSGGTDISAQSINALVDVDTTTNAPAAGQSLIWNAIDNEWIPGNANPRTSGDILIVGTSEDRVYRHNGTSWDSGFAIPASEFSPTGIAVDPANGDLFLAGNTTDRVYRHNGTSWDSGFAIPTNEINPGGISVDPANGDILIVGISTNRVYRYDRTSGWDSGFAIPGNETIPNGISVDPSNGDILIVGTVTDRVYRHDGTSWDSGVAVPDDEENPSGITIDPANGDILLVGTSTDRIYRYDGTSWDQGFAVPASELMPLGLTIHFSGTDTNAIREGARNLYYTNARADARIAASSINALSDVDTTSTAPTTNQVLQWNGTNWVPATPESGPENTDGLTEGSTNLYFTGARVTTQINVTSIDALSDVDTTTNAPANNQVLSWNGTNWVPSTLAISNNAASESAAGIVELATTAEARAGTDTSRAVTPAGLEARIEAQHETQILLAGFSTNVVYRWDGSAWDSGFALPTGVASPTGLAVDPTTGDILIMGNTRRIYRYDGTSWDSGFAVPTNEASPQGLAVDPTTGDILLTGVSTDVVYRWDGSAWDSGFAVPSGETVPAGLAVDPTNGDILLTGIATDRVYRWNGASWDSGFAVPTNEDSPQGLAVDPTNGDILLAGTATDRVYRWNGASWDSGFAVPTGENGPTGLAISFRTPVIPRDTDALGEGARNLYYTDARADARIAASGIDALSDVDTSTTAPTAGQALIWDATDSEWVPGTIASGGTTAAASEDAAGIVELATVAEARAGTDTARAVTPAGLEARIEAQHETQILLTGTVDSRIYRYDGSAWDAGFAIPTGGNTPHGLAVDPTNGDILMVDRTDRVYRWNGASWDIGFRVPSAETSPTGLAVDPTTGDILVVGIDARRIYRHDGSAWDSGFAVPSGELFPAGLAVDPTNGDILLTGTATDRVYRWDGSAWDSGFAVPTNETAPQGLAMDPTNGDILLVGFTTDRVYRWDGSAWDSGFAVPTTENSPSGLAISFRLPIIPRDTDALGEGARNLYYTDARANARIAASSINALSDVDTVSAAPTNGQALVWNSTDSEWVPGTIASGTDISTQSIDALADVDTTSTSPTNGQALVWNSTDNEWVPGDVAASAFDTRISALEDLETRLNRMGATARVIQTGVQLDHTSSDNNAAPATLMTFDEDPLDYDYIQIVLSPRTNTGNLADDPVYGAYTYSNELDLLALMTAPVSSITAGSDIRSVNGRGWGYGRVEPNSVGALGGVIHRTANPLEWWIGTPGQNPNRGSYDIIGVIGVRRNVTELSAPTRHSASYDVTTADRFVLATGADIVISGLSGIWGVQFENSTAIAIIDMDDLKSKTVAETGDTATETNSVTVGFDHPVHLGIRLYLGRTDEGTLLVSVSLPSEDPMPLNLRRISGSLPLDLRESTSFSADVEHEANYDVTTEDRFVLATDSADDIDLTDLSGVWGIQFEDHPFKLIDIDQVKALPAASSGALSTTSNSVFVETVTYRTIATGSILNHNVLYIGRTSDNRLLVSSTHASDDSDPMPLRLRKLTGVLDTNLAGAIRYDREQTLSIAEQGQAELNIGGPFARTSSQQQAVGPQPIGELQTFQYLSQIPIAGFAPIKTLPVNVGTDGRIANYVEAWITDSDPDLDFDTDLQFYYRIGTVTFPKALNTNGRIVFSSSEFDGNNLRFLIRNISGAPVNTVSARAQAYRSDMVGESVFALGPGNYTLTTGNYFHFPGGRHYHREDIDRIEIGYSSGQISTFILGNMNHLAVATASAAPNSALGGAERFGDIQFYGWSGYPPISRLYGGGGSYLIDSLNAGAYSIIRFIRSDTAQTNTVGGIYVCAHAGGDGRTIYYIKLYPRAGVTL